MPCYGARSVFVSDMHLGWSGSRPQRALAWLTQQRPQHLYLVGDTFEGITRPLDLELPCVRTLFDALERLQEEGCSIHILVGNHDHQLAESPAAIRWPIQSHTIHRPPKERNSWWFTETSSMRAYRIIMARRESWRAGGIRSWFIWGIRWVKRGMLRGHHVTRGTATGVRIGNQGSHESRRT